MFTENSGFIGNSAVSGSSVALVTPMDETGHVDLKGLKKLVDYHVDSGTSAIISMGTTGESATLSLDEHVDVVLKTLEFADGRIPVIAGTGANATAEAITLTQRLHNSGIIACLSITPYYNKPTQEGLYQHFKAIAQSTDLPQILYNVPSRTGCDLLPETVARLAKIGNIVGIKEATGNLSRVSQIQSLVNDNRFILLSGDDVSALDFVRLGGHGVISVTSNIAAREMVQVFQLMANGDVDAAYSLNQRLMALHHDLFIEANPIPVKWACKALGLIATDTMRLPMTPLSEKACPVVERALKQSGVL